MAGNVNTLDAPIVYRTEEECIPNNVVRDSAGNPLKNTDGSWQTSGEEILDPGPQVAKNQGLLPSQQVPKSFLFSVNNPDPPSGIGRLNRLHIKALMTVVGKTASGFVYNCIGPTLQVGKYQLSSKILTNLNYLKPDYYDLYRESTINYPGAWTGKDGIYNLNAWFLSTGVQEKTMFQLLSSNYMLMEANGGIKEDDNLCTIAGMLCVAHILGPDQGTDQRPGAVKWRQTGGGQDINGNTGGLYFSLGRYAVDILSSKTTV